MTAPGEDTQRRGNPALGSLAFTRECGQCHTTGDGFDLTFFGYADSTIIRRAVAHVDTTTALHIVAHIRSLGSPRAREDTRLFQPGGTPLGSDVGFAVALFGADAWPAGLTTAGLRAINPLQVRIALPLPMWSDEGTNLDWMPDAPLPEHALRFEGRRVEGALAGYRAAPSRENLLRVVMALRAAERTPSAEQAPCLFDDPARFKPRECFEIRRWASNLVAQHMLRSGLMSQSLGPELHDIWWDVGNAARRSRGSADPIEHAVENWASWMFLGWAFDPSRHASVYTGGGFRQLGLPRHATFIALRSQVARRERSPAPYADLLNAVRFAPTHWARNVAEFGFRHLVERLEAGDRPARPEQIAEARTQVQTALADANRKVTPADREVLVQLAERVLTLLGPA
jgi:hypothetical protein